ncbi:MULTISPECIES: efflux RND transporter periplasmic adaptor subunit [Aliivibrio]|uniref:Efflux RND transporter periplasmic adaptor subunit n=1 Tax=Aliivibrio finisterrensis TaxID=511998 RepID=A0A4Q5KL53_9GAMM|nr:MULTISPECIES: efflux RND transporter periplasmic adaptor subunit [Aliivibrio]MDD9173696.1 efflux RND transporter periplasmic adaptor subunit [Aliivibrio sp. S3TY1]MDD9178826.1 efflux RND transporter periplasmic adaptor subunit [Aliivibrio sp. A6]MDD9190772.1 efflux RND transporter periplasmic adaptor subunit [Aliivibrio sp. S2TY2]RYU47000.1 efflux RND transporter periplasmic adaptor subunit [Aliivibrio finisterrensis]RYU50182.1 efflux RND transporter periplasmic adaptor subunit [Aliivibrio 
MFKKTMVATVLSSTLLIGCGKQAPVIAEPESRPAKIMTVTVGDHETSRLFPAQAEAGDKAVLAFRVPGQLNSLDVHAGQLVTKGQLLATINPDEYRLIQKQAQAQYRLIDVQYQRIKKLRKDKVVSEQDYDSAVANRKTAKATLDQASANLSYTQLSAPYDGTISLLPAENYEYVTAKQPIMHIQTNDILYVAFQLPDYLLQRFSFTQVSASVTFDSFPTVSFPLEFEEIDTEADSKTSSYTVKMSMPRPKDLGILPGMSGQVKVTIPKGGSEKLPLSAIEQDGDTTYVWRVSEQGIVEKIAIELNEKRQVISGLNDSEQIVSSGISGLEEGMKVRKWVKERGL